jgi:hypothetical protein
MQEQKWTRATTHTSLEPCFDQADGNACATAYQDLDSEQDTNDSSDGFNDEMSNSTADRTADNPTTNPTSTNQTIRIEKTHDGNPNDDRNAEVQSVADPGLSDQVTEQLISFMANEVVDNLQAAECHVDGLTNRTEGDIIALLRTFSRLIDCRARHAVERSASTFVRFHRG